MMIKGKMYDYMKFITQVALPALGTLYFALAGIWGLPAAEEIVGSIVAVDTFLGVLLQISANNYKNSDARFDGTIGVFENDGKKVFTLNLDSDPEKLDEKDEVVFKVGESLSK